MQMKMILLVIFVFAGYQPNTSLVKDIVELNESGYIVTDQNLKNK
mgnify:CR=1 FL=1